jgi:hypothetical protein
VERDAHLEPSAPRPAWGAADARRLDPASRERFRARSDHPHLRARGTPLQGRDSDPARQARARQSRERGAPRSRAAPRSRSVGVAAPAAAGPHGGAAQSQRATAPAVLRPITPAVARSVPTEQVAGRGVHVSQRNWEESDYGQYGKRALSRTGS